MTEAEVEDLLRAIPEFRETFEEHVRENGEVLSYLLHNDLARFIAREGETSTVVSLQRGAQYLNAIARDDVRRALALEALSTLAVYYRPSFEVILPLLDDGLRSAVRREWT